MTNRIKLRGLPEDVIAVLVELARAASVELAVLVDEWDAVEESTVESGPGGIRVRTKTEQKRSLSGFFPLTLDQVTDFCLNDPATLEGLTASGGRAVYALDEPHEVDFLDLWVWEADVEAARETLSSLGPFGAPVQAELPAAAHGGRPQLPAGFHELLAWAHENVPKLLKGRPRLNKEDVEEELFRRARDFKVPNPRAVARLAWLWTNPAPGGGRPEKEDV